MATLETQYKHFLLDNPESKLTFEEWKEWIGKHILEQINELKNESNSKKG